MFSHPELGSDPPNGSGRESGLDRTPSGNDPAAMKQDDVVCKRPLKVSTRTANGWDGCASTL